MHTSFLLSLATLTVAFSGLSAQAGTIDSANTKAIAPVNAQKLNFPATEPQSNLAITPVQVVSPITVAPAAKPIPGKAMTSASALRAQTYETVAPAVAQVDTTTPDTTDPSQTVPDTTTPDTTDPSQTVPDTITPGTTDPSQTAPDTITPDTTDPSQTIPDTTEPDTTDPSQTIPDTTEPDTITPDSTDPSQTAPDTTEPDTTEPDTTEPDTTEPGPGGISPGRATRSGPSYIGVAGNIGLGEGDTALGESSFAVISKIGVTPNFSVRPSVFVDDDPTILIPVTYDLLPRGVEAVQLSVAPYIGAGAAISIGDDSAVDFLLTGGIDVPLTPQFTATAAVNATVFDNAAVGLIIGIAYNFPGGF